MRNLDEYRAIFLVVVAVAALLVASPALSRLLVYPRTEFFTELWILGPSHKAENYPYNVTRNQNYAVFLGIGNRLGYCAYYMVKVKFRNQSQEAPTSFGPVENRSPSSLPSLFNFSVFVADEQILETPLTFSFDYVYNESTSSVNFSGLKLNGNWLNMTDYTVSWDSEKNEFRGFLFFELWLYNASAGDFQYHGRFVSLRFNMTASV